MRDELKMISSFLKTIGSLTKRIRVESEETINPIFGILILRCCQVQVYSLYLDIYD